MLLQKFIPIAIEGLSPKVRDTRLTRAHEKIITTKVGGKFLLLRLVLPTEEHSIIACGKTV
jgi:hypothetical protein